MWRPKFWGGSGSQRSKDAEKDSKPRLDKTSEKLRRKYGLQTGSCDSQDGKVQVGWATLRGKRPYNEDTVHASFSSVSSGSSSTSEGSGSGSGFSTGPAACQQVCCMGVFDGHGGPHAAAFVRDRVFENLLSHGCFQHDVFQAVEDAYLATDAQYVELDADANQDDGCCALTAVVLGQRLVVAHVGDSRGVLSHNGQAVELTQDHKPNRNDERCRIESAGGTVVWSGTWRVLGILAVSRSFGDRGMKQYIIPHPEIREDVLGSSNTCLVLATDGMWDVMSNQEAIDQACKYGDAETAARALTADAYKRGSLDNISCVVAFFKFSDNDDGLACSTPSQ